MKEGDDKLKGSSICRYDDGSPLYAFKCGTTEPQCLHGVASYERARVGTPSNECTGGSFFANVPKFYQWMADLMVEDLMAAMVLQLKRRDDTP